LAGQAFQGLYVFRIEVGKLSVYVASSLQGAVRVDLSVEPPKGPVEFFQDRFEGLHLLEAFSPNRDLISSVVSALSGEPSYQIPPLAVSLTPFQNLVLQEILTIPFGHTLTYGQVAKRIRKPKAARAVGQALGRNPLPLVFP